LSLYVLIERRLSSMIEAIIICLFLLCNGIDVMYASESIYWIFSVTGSDQFFSVVSGALLVQWTQTSTKGQHSFVVHGPRTWNYLPEQCSTSVSRT